MKVKSAAMLLVVLLMLFVISCSNDAKENAKVKTIRVSSYATLGSSTKNEISKGASVSDLDFKETVKNSVNNEKTATPIAFTLNLNETTVYMPRDNADIQAGSSSQFSIVPNGEYGNSRNVNMLFAKALDSKTVSGVKGVYNGVAFSFLPFIGESNGTGHTDPVRLISAICVKLPEGIQKGKIKNMSDSTNLPNMGDDCVWFEYRSLIPYAISTDAFLSYICFQTGIDKATLVGAEDHSGEHYTYGPVNTRGNACALSIPLSTSFDISKYENPEISINYNVKDLIQFFVQDNDDVYAYFNKTDPFPISLSIGEYSENPSVTIDTVNDADSYPFNCFKIRRNNCMLLQYTKPTNTNYKGIQIFKSDSAMILNDAKALIEAYDNSGTLGESLKLLYEGNADYYQDMMSNSADCTASYFIRSLTKTGKSTVVEFKFWDN